MCTYQNKLHYIFFHIHIPCWLNLILFCQLHPKIKLWQTSGARGRQIYMLKMYRNRHFHMYVDARGTITTFVSHKHSIVMQFLANILCITSPFNPRTFYCGADGRQIHLLELYAPPPAATCVQLIRGRSRATGVVAPPLYTPFVGVVSKVGVATQKIFPPLRRAQLSPLSTYLPTPVK